MIILNISYRLYFLKIKKRVKRVKTINKTVKDD